MRILFGRWLGMMIILALPLLEAQAQEKPNIFANPKNLKILPKDITPEELRDTMRGFARQVGIRCSQCHEGPEGRPIEEYDFASDVKELKQVARVMLKMVNTINETVGGLDRGPDHEAVEVQCVTCHRGVRKPEMIQDILAKERADGGLDAAEARYRELHLIYFPGFQYDFSPRRLGDFANTLFSEGDIEGGMRFHGMNRELYPGIAWTYLSFGNGMESLGRISEAVAAYEKVLELDPEFEFLTGVIADLKKQMGGEEN